MIELNSFQALMAIYLAGFFFFTLVSRRCHLVDKQRSRGKSGWWVLFWVVVWPISIALIILYLTGVIIGVVLSPPTDWKNF